MYKTMNVMLSIYQSSLSDSRGSKRHELSFSKVTPLSMLKHGPIFFGGFSFSGFRRFLFFFIFLSFRSLMVLIPGVFRSDSTKLNHLLGSGASKKCCLRRCSRKRKIGHHFRFQRGADLLDAAVIPVGISSGTQRVQHKVLVASDKIIDIRRWHGREYIQFQGDLSTVGVQREIIDVVAKGVLDFTADSIKPENDIRSNYASSAVVP